MMAFIIPSYKCITEKCVAGQTIVGKIIPSDVGGPYFLDINDDDDNDVPTCIKKCQAIAECRSFLAMMGNSAHECVFFSTTFVEADLDTADQTAWTSTVQNMDCTSNTGKAQGTCF